MLVLAFYLLLFLSRMSTHSQVLPRRVQTWVCLSHRSAVFSTSLTSGAFTPCSLGVLWVFPRVCQILCHQCYRKLVTTVTKQRGVNLCKSFKERVTFLIYWPVGSAVTANLILIESDMTFCYLAPEFQTFPHFIKYECINCWIFIWCITKLGIVKK